jgi:hypothetical protein
MKPKPRTLLFGDLSLEIFFKNLTPFLPPNFLYIYLFFLSYVSSLNFFTLSFS